MSPTKSLSGIRQVEDFKKGVRTRLYPIDTCGAHLKSDDTSFTLPVCVNNIIIPALMDNLHNEQKIEVDQR